MSIVLETKNLSKSFGGLKATDNVSFQLKAGARHALIGPNGAGKTTFVNLLSGVLQPSSGSIWLDGQEITNWTSRRRAISGLARTFQINQLFVDLTPLQTLMIAIAERQSSGAHLLHPVGSRKDHVEESVELLTRLGLADVMTQRVGSLPYGRQRLIEIALALAARPRVLLLDEPAAGVPESERGQILDVIDALPKDVALVLIEHDMDLVFRFAKSISVLVNGALFMEGTPSQIANDPLVRQVYLGEEEIAHV